MRNYITRTFSKNLCTCTVFDAGKLDSVAVLIPTGYNDSESAERYIRRRGLVTGKLVEVSNIERVDELFGMEESKFLSLAKPVDERSKETRDAITKTIISVAATLLYMTKDRKVESVAVFLPKNASKKESTAAIAARLPDGAKPITLEDKRELSAIYALDEATFIANASRMKDHFHLDMDSSK